MTKAPQKEFEAVSPLPDGKRTRQHDPSRRIRPSRVRAPSPGRRPAGSESDQVDDELTPAQIREIERRVADYDDVTRYLLVSRIGPRFALYYNVTDDVYATDAQGGTMFKRRRAALAVKALLRPGILVLTCKSKRGGGDQVPILDPAGTGGRTVHRLPSERPRTDPSAKRKARRLRRGPSDV